jgi:3-oxoacyl-[acyl-carrier protein] reductase
MFDISGKSALITGASGVIGSAIARYLYRQGAAVGLSGTRVDQLEYLAQELGVRACVLPGDLSKKTIATELVHAAENVFGQVDILVNSAGMTRDNIAMRMRDEEFETVIDLNLIAAFRMVRAVIKGMIKRRWGRIINITSVVAFAGNPGQANYAASKGGLVGMTKSLAAELGSRNITVNCLAPGFVTSTMTSVISDSHRASLLEKIPAGRFGEPADVAAAVVFLASEEAAYITGQTLHINGGMIMT